MKTKILLLTACHIAILAVCCFGQNSPASDTPDKNSSVKPLSRTEMVNIIAAKNIFKPSQGVAVIGRISPTVTTLPSGPTALLRPFTLIGINISDQEAKAQLLFSNPVARKAVSVGDSVESITITKIESTYIRCSYAGYDVKIDVGESSEDARRRILGFERDFEFIGTTISEKETFAYVKIGDELRRLEVGDALGESEIISIQEGKLWIRHSNGMEFEINPTSLSSTTE